MAMVPEKSGRQQIQISSLFWDLGCLYKIKSAALIVPINLLDEGLESFSFASFVYWLAVTLYKLQLPRTPFPSLCIFEEAALKTDQSKLYVLCSFFIGSVKNAEGRELVLSGAIAGGRSG